MVTLLPRRRPGLLFRDDPAPAGAGDPCGGRRAGAAHAAVTRRLLDSYLVTLAPPPPPEAAALAGLSPREREIFGLVARGLGAEIAGTC